jgi:hypothetical protein
VMMDLEFVYELIVETVTVILSTPFESQAVLIFALGCDVTQELA